PVWQPALGAAIFDIAKAQSKSGAEPDRMWVDIGRAAVAAMGHVAHRSTICSSGDNAVLA
ncbi:MAG: hypothetical protein OEL78_09590, partial [Hyphomicrobiales bacterium]|nr:hypothetical protein [Hyphomicrobiales bacterium]